jgi:hypothetical protein
MLYIVDGIYMQAWSPLTVVRYGPKVLKEYQKEYWYCITYDTREYDTHKYVYYTCSRKHNQLIICCIS